MTLADEIIPFIPRFLLLIIILFTFSFMIDAYMNARVHTFPAEAAILTYRVGHTHLLQETSHSGIPIQSVKESEFSTENPEVLLSGLIQFDDKKYISVAAKFQQKELFMNRRYHELLKTQVDAGKRWSNNIEQLKTVHSFENGELHIEVLQPS